MIPELEIIAAERQAIYEGAAEALHGTTWDAGQQRLTYRVITPQGLARERERGEL